MSDERIELDVTLRDQASAGLDDIAKKTDKLEKADPTINVDADTEAATRDLADVKDDTNRLDSTDWVVKVRAELADAKSQVQDLTGDLQKTGSQADDTSTHMDKLSGEGGLHTRGQAIADLTGPLGDASGAASDFAGVFDGIGDIAGDVASKVGLDAVAMESAIGGIGIAVAGAAALWTIFTGNQEKAKKKQAELLKGQQDINKALEEGNTGAAAQGLIDTYKGVYDAAKKAGIPVSEVTAFLTGQSDALGTATAKQQAYTDAIAASHDDVTAAGVAAGEHTAELVTQRDAYDDLIGKIHDGRQSYIDTNGTLSQQKDKLEQVTTALGGTVEKQDALTESVKGTHDELDKLRGGLSFEREVEALQTGLETALTNVSTGAGNTKADILDLKSSIIDLGETAGKTPVEIKAELDKVDQGDLMGVAADVQSWYANNPVNIATKLDIPTRNAIIKQLANAGLVPAGSVAGLSTSAGAAPVVNVNLPRGTRTLETAATPRRHGRRYGNAVVAYARRR